MAMSRTMQGSRMTGMRSKQPGIDPLWGSTTHRHRFKPNRYLAIFTICLAFSWIVAHLVNIH